MNKLEAVRRAASIVVGFGTAKVVKAIIQHNTAPKNVFDNVAITAASYVLGAVAADISQLWVDAKFDELVQWWDENVTDRRRAA